MLVLAAEEKVGALRCCGHPNSAVVSAFNEQQLPENMPKEAVHATASWRWARRSSCGRRAGCGG